MKPARLWTPLIALLLIGTTACSAAQSAQTSPPASSAAAGSLTLYTGRDEELIGPIIAKFTAETGHKVEVRYGNSAEMASQLIEEGANTPADVFYSQEVGAVGALAKRDLLGDLPAATVAKADQRFRPTAGSKWVGVTARSRVIVYNKAALNGAAEPKGVAELTGATYSGKVAVVPGNAGFQAFITGFRVSQGDAATTQWLKAMKVNTVNTGYESNGDVLEAVNKGDIAVGLINHYYWARQPEADRAKATLVFPSGDDPGGLVNATAAGVTPKGATNPAAVALVDYLLSPAGQQAFVEQTWEYPVVDGVADPTGIPALSDLTGPKLDLGDLDSLEATQKLLTQEGYLS